MADVRAITARLPKIPPMGPKARRFAIIGAVVVVVGGGAAVAWAATRSPGASYRMATAGPASVTQSLSGTGTIQPVSQATVMFPTSGQIQSVGVRIGQQVDVGQTLAQLNTTSLSDTLSSDQSAVATAQAKLATDQNSETSVSEDGAQVTSPSAVGASGGSGLTQLVHSLSGDQNAVRAAQQKVDKDLELVTAAEHQVTEQGAACQDLLDQLSAAGQPTQSNTPSTTSSSPSTSDGATTTGTTPPVSSTTPDSTSVSDCEQLINQALSDESAAAGDEHTLTTAVATLSTALNKVVAAVGQSASQQPSGQSGSGTHGSSGGSTGGSGNSGRSGSSGSSSGSGSSRSGSGGTGSGPGSGSGESGGGRSTGPASADQIAADQANVDAANAELAVAQQNLSAATLVSPISGTVADVTMAAGQTASANSASAQIVVIGPGQDEVTTAVTDSQVGQVKPGDNATITPDGATKPISGKVTQIGALNTTTSSGAAGYPVTISLDSTSQQLFDGATASVGITLGTAQAAVTVPTSAVHTIGGFSVVSKIVNGKIALTRVTVGVQGPTVTQITSGLKAGDQVELADMTAALPTATNSPGGAIRLGGGAGGGGFGGAGAFRSGGGGGRGGG